MRTASFIARRYLIAKKSHNVINIISTISAIGIAIGTAALIIILSIYNGFDALIKDMMSNIEPDLCVSPTTGKVFDPDPETLAWIEHQPEVQDISQILEETVFISYDGRKKPALVKGVDAVYEETSTLRDHLYEGKFELHHGDIPKAAVGIGLASDLGIRTRFLSPIEIWFPSRTRRISPVNPAAALESVDVYPSSIFTINNEVDSKLMIVPIGSMRELLDYDTEISQLEIRLAADTEKGPGKERIAAFQKVLQKKLGPDFLIQNRYQQNESLYKMMRSEKAAIFIILLFIVVITLFNIFGSLSMLIIEKRKDTATLESMGARQSLIRQIFIQEGWFICLTGLVAGLIIGIGFAWSQQQFGFIKMPGNFMVDAYPVIISWTDVLLTAAGVAILGYLISLLPVLTFYRKEKK